MKDPATVQKIVITTVIQKKLHYIKRFVNQKETGKLIPIYSLDAYQAKWFLQLEEAFTAVDLIVPPGMRAYNVGTVNLQPGVTESKPGNLVIFENHKTINHTLKHKAAAL
jgi:hypothetical protein